jgi:DNA-binding PadR family transcriptional regulator
MTNGFDDCWDFGFGFGFGPPRRHRRRGRRFRWRMFERGDLKFVILGLIADRPMHGYEVMKALEEESRGTYRASPGSVYPTLQMLEDAGYLRSEQQEGNKRVYHITPEGQSYLDENRDAVEDVFERVTSFTSSFFGEGVRDLSTSFRRLAQTTFESAMQSSGNPDAIRRMVEILENAERDVRKAQRDRARPEDSTV